MDYTNDNRPSYSRFASQGEIRESLQRIAFDDNNPKYGGIPLDSEEGAVYVEQEDYHSLIFGSTGSKKTRLIGMPALLMYAMAGESFIATDPKAELYRKTYQTLIDHDYRIFVLNLRDPMQSNAWNPLRIPYLQYKNGQKDKATEFVNDTAGCIIKSGMTREPYWENCAADVLSGLIMLLFEYAKENEIHFRSLRTLRQQAFKNCEHDVTYIQEHFLKYLDKTSFLCSLLSGTAELNDHTRGCIISEFDQAMRPFFCQDNLIDILSGNEIEMNEIGITKTAVFLIIPDENTLYNSLVSVFVKQCYSELLNEAKKHPKNRLPIRVNFLLDEFSNMPTISDFPSMITASRSRNIRFNLIIQNQLFKRYGCDVETIKANCENWVFLHSREYSLLDEIVNLSGKKNSEEALVSMSTLQTLDKDKGEAYVIHRRFNPYIAHLLDIDKYPNMSAGEQDVPYPEANCKATEVFDFVGCCHMITNPNMEPIFTSVVPSDEEIQETADEEENEEPPVERYAAGVGSGWHGLLFPIFEEIKLYNKENHGYKIRIDQIKEKWGTLRFYVSDCPEYIQGMISIAEKESGHICEFCGAQGETVLINHWYKTLCPHHRKAFKAAGYDHKLSSSLYRKFMDTYERSRWTGTYNPVIKKCLKKNRFITKEKVDGIERVIKLERENQRTYFYLKTGKEYKKHGFYVQWHENKDKTLHQGYWHVMKDNEIEFYGTLERDSAEKEAAKMIFHCCGRKLNMELIRMVSFEEGQAFPQCSVQENHGDYWEFVKRYLINNNIKMTGAEHHKYGIPLIENNGTVYAFTLSFSKWGKLMAEAFDPKNNDETALLKWAGERPEGEESWVNPDFEER
jgi:type IV secretion system protein VirD4